MVTIRLLYRPRKLGRDGFYRYGWTFAHESLETAERYRIPWNKHFLIRLETVQPGDFDHPDVVKATKRERAKARKRPSPTPT
jgi:hypothetical protein